MLLLKAISTTEIAFLISKFGENTSCIILKELIKERVNKYDLDIDYCQKIEQFSRENGIAILGKLPYDKIFVKALVNMTPVIGISKEQEKNFRDIADRLLAELS